MWYFERVGLLSHMPALILNANAGLNQTNSNNDKATTENGTENHQEEKENPQQTMIDPAWSAADERNVIVKTLWDNPRLHDEVLF